MPETEFETRCSKQPFDTRTRKKVRTDFTSEIIMERNRWSIALENYARTMQTSARHIVFTYQKSYLVHVYALENGDVDEMFAKTLKFHVQQQK